MAKQYLSTPPAGQSPGMAIQKNPYASDQAGGYNMFTGDYEADKADMWTKLMDALAQMGQKPPAKQEFDAYYDSMVQGASLPDASGGSALPEQDWRMWEGAPASSRKEAEAGLAKESEDSWQRMLKSLKSSQPSGTTLGPLPPPAAPPPKPAAEPDMMDKPLPADFATQEEYEAALQEWKYAGKNYF